MATRSADGLQVLLGSVGADGPVPQFPLADVLTSPMAIYLSYLSDILVRLTGCEPEHAYDSIQWPNDVGDLVVVVPRLKLKDSNSNELAIELQKTFPASSLFDHPFEDGINLRVLLTPGTLARILLPYVIDRGPSYGTDPANGLIDPGSADSGRKKVVVEFSSPNLGKEFDGLHLRSTLIGMYIASTYGSMGWDVVKINYLGDWGKHIGLLAAGWARFGSEELFEADPIAHLLDVFTKVNGLFKLEQDDIKALKAEDPNAAAAKEMEGVTGEKDAFFKKMEDRDADALALWQRFRDVCIAGYSDLYSRLNITFDEYSGESQVTQDTIAEVESVLKEKGVYHESEGAWVIDLQSCGAKGGLGMAIARFRNGTTSYLLRDVATVLERSKKHSFDKMVYVVSSRQDLHFQQLFASLELMGHADLAGRLQHVSFGKAKGLAPMQGSSGLLLDHILDRCQTSVDAALEAEPDACEEFPKGDAEVSGALSASVLMTQELVHRRSTAVNFETDKLKVTDAHTGLALQQWYAALNRKLEGSVVDPNELEDGGACIAEKDEHVDVLRLLIQFPDIVKTSFRSLESPIILTYLFRLTDVLGTVWEDGDEGEGEVVNGENGVEEKEEGGDKHPDVGRLALFHCVRQVLENGMKMVGLVPLQV